MALQLGQIAPDFEQDSTDGRVSFHQWLGDSWGVLFSHPKDYTPVCTTELGEVARLAPEWKKRDVKVIANAGGVNPIACAREVRRLAPSLKVAVATGDDVFGRLDEFLAAGHEMKNMDTGEPLSAIRGLVAK